MAGKKNNKTKPKDAPPSGGSSSSAPSGKLKPAQSIKVRHIFSEKHSIIQKALKELRGEELDEEDEEEAKMNPDKKKPKAEPFDVVAGKYSEDRKKYGGSLGWKPRGSLLAEFEKVAYELEPSTVEKPKFKEVTTRLGYHIVMVEGRK